MSTTTATRYDFAADVARCNNLPEVMSLQRRVGAAGNDSPEFCAALDARVAEILKGERDSAAAAAAKAQPNRSLTTRVGIAGGCCVYGLQERPVTLYPAQWRRLADYLPTVLAYLDSDPVETIPLNTADRKVAAEKHAKSAHVVKVSASEITVRLSKGKV